MSTSFSGTGSIACDFLAYGAIPRYRRNCAKLKPVLIRNADETLGALIDGALVTVFVGVIMLGFPH